MRFLAAGGDRSGRLDRDQIVVFCFAAVNDAEAWSETCRAMRKQFGMTQDTEFHGHEMELPQILTFLQKAQVMNVQVGALLIDRGEQPFSTNSALDQANIMLDLLRSFLPQCALQRLWCDEDIKGKKAQQKFVTEAQRISRAIYPGTKMDVKFRKSHSSDLIQLADVMAYALSRQARKTLKHMELEQLLKALRSDGGNLIIGPVEREK